MKLDNALTAGLLVKVVNILCDDSLKLALSLKSYESLVSLIRPCVRIDKLTLVEIIEIFRMLHEKVVSNDVDRSVFGAALRVVDTGSASEVRNSTLCGYTGSAKENDVFRFRDQLFKLV